MERRYQGLSWEQCEELATKQFGPCPKRVDQEFHWFAKLPSCIKGPLESREQAEKVSNKVFAEVRNKREVEINFFARQDWYDKVQDVWIQGQKKVYPEFSDEVFDLVVETVKDLDLMSGTHCRHEMFNSVAGMVLKLGGI